MKGVDGAKVIGAPRWCERGVGMGWAPLEPMKLSIRGIAPVVLSYRPPTCRRERSQGSGAMAAGETIDRVDRCCGAHELIDISTSICCIGNVVP